jgi:surfeit locus 1 family protein
MNRALFLIIIGLGGAAILVSLGVWQVQRLAWKESVIADIEARIVAAPVTVPATADIDLDEHAYLPVQAEGHFLGDTLRVLVSQKEIGAGYRLISSFETDDRYMLVDRGFIRADASTPPLPEGSITVTGNLQWPRETDRFTPERDLTENIWFSRDVLMMSIELKTLPLMIVARDISPPEALVTPLPVDTSRIPNDHLQYAITWFSLAAIWLAMSLLFLRRRRSIPTESET